MKSVHNKNFIKYLIFAGSIVMLFICIFIRIIPASPVSAADIGATFSFSPQGGFYNEDIKVDLSDIQMANPFTSLRFTLDGSEPDLSSTEYDTPFIIKNPDKLSAVTLRVSAFDIYGEKAAGPFTATYIMGEDINTETNVIYVSLTSDEEGLYSKERGILYPMMDCGTTEEDWNLFKRQNCRKRSESTFDDSWIRKAHMQIFESDGSLVMDQGVGLCVDGDHGSMLHYPYSLKVLANSIFDEYKNSFSYNFFDFHSASGTDYAHIQQYNNMVFRNGGNEYIPGTRNARHRGVFRVKEVDGEYVQDMDNTAFDYEFLAENNGTMLRWAIGSTLAEKNGFMCAGNRVALVFLNGELYGITSLQDTYNRFNTAIKARLYKDSIQIFKGEENVCTENAGFIDAYYSFPDVENTPVVKEDNQEFIESMVDMEDMFRYYAFLALVNNTDFPKKNYAMWRSQMGEVEGITSYYSDGLYRFLINDLDCTYDFRYDDDLWVAYFHNIKERGTLMGSLMYVPKYRNMFINILCDLFNTGFFDDENILKVIDDADRDFSSIEGLVYDKGAIELRKRNVERLKAYAVNRKSQLNGYMEETFGLKKPYTLKVKAPDEGAVINFSSVKLRHIDGDFTGEYYGDCPIVFTCDTNGYTGLKHWVVNGAPFKGDYITVDSSLIYDGRITIELVLDDKKEEEALMISEVSDGLTEGWVEIYNPSAVTVNLSDFSIYNGAPTGIGKYRLPEKELPPGDVFMLGVDNRGFFKIEQDGIIGLMNRRGVITDECKVPVMDYSESYGRYGETDTWKYYPNPTPGEPQ